MPNPSDRASSGALHPPGSSGYDDRDGLTAAPSAARAVPGRATTPDAPAAAPVRRSPSRMQRILARRRLLSALAAVLVLAYGGWRYVRAREAGAVTYRFATVERGSIRQSVSATGTLGAVKTVAVGTQVSGQIIAEYADFNSRVTRGQLLARVDPTLQEQAVRDAEAQLAKARAQLNQAQQEYDRNAPLAAQKFISASEFSTVQVNRAVAQATVRSAQVTLDRARQNLSYTSIHAPISGVVVERNVDVGQTVAASLQAPQIFLIAQDLAQMQILAAVDESDIASIRQGQNVQFTVQSYPDRVFQGVVDQVRLQSKVTDNVVNYTVVVKTDNPDGKLLPGMTATVAFITGAASNVLLVPNAALRYRPSPEELAEADRGAAGADSSRRGSRSGAARRSGSGGGRGGDSGSGGARGRAGPRPLTRGTLYTREPSGKLRVIRVRTGLTDGQRTQVSGEGVAEGMQVVIGSSGGAEAAAAPAPTSSPLTPTRGGPGGRRRF